MNKWAEREEKIRDIRDKEAAYREEAEELLEQADECLAQALAEEKSLAAAQKEEEEAAGNFRDYMIRDNSSVRNSTVRGEPVEIEGLEGLDFFVHRSHAGWSLSEASTGYGASPVYPCKEDAIRDGSALLVEKGKESIQEAISMARSNHENH